MALRTGPWCRGTASSAAVHGALLPRPALVGRALGMPVPTALQPGAPFLLEGRMSSGPGTRCYAVAAVGTTSAGPRGSLPPKPSDPAYFTGNPHYYHRLMRLTALLRQYGLPTHYGGVPGKAPVSDVQWMSMQEMKDLLGIKFVGDAYQDLLDKLNTLVTGVPEEHKSEALLSFLQEFTRPGTTLQQATRQRGTVDEVGRSYTVASRKSAKCQAWLIPGDGQVYIDGLHLSDRFPLPSLQEVVMRPFDVTRTWGQYNVWALTQAGGLSGKAGAVAIAVARGLAVQDAGLEGPLKAEGLLDIDRRQKERKKTGQPKARKKNSWVKR